MKKKKRQPHQFACESRLDFAKKLRDNPTRFESWLWKKFRRGVCGSVVWRQTVIWNYIVDFYIPEFRIAVELDGKQHDPSKDSHRDEYLFHKGVITLRFKNPTSQADANIIYSQVYAEVRSQRHREKVGLSTFPPDSSFSFSSSDYFLGRQKIKPKNNERCVKVDISSGCQRQRFVSQDLAERFARMMANIGVRTEIKNCEECKAIHVIEA
jgi:very-short-patch-repair endonuclease